MKHFSLICLILFAFSACNKKVSKTFVEATSVGVEKKRAENPCFDSQNYAPDLDYPEHTPTKYVKMIFHYIFHPELKYRQDEQFYEDFVEKIVKKMNYRLKKHVQMNLPPGNDTPVLPIPFRFVISPDPDVKGDNGIYFHEHEELCFFNKDMKAKTSMASRDQYDTYGVRKGEVINVFFMEHHPDSIASKTYKAAQNGISGGTWLKLAGIHEHIARDVCADDEWPADCLAAQFYGIMNHEAGHALGLSHTWRSNDGCDDTPKSGNCYGLNVPPKPECDEPSELSNNVMDYNNKQSAWTPCQLGRVYYKMMKDGSRQRKFLDDRWCDYKVEATITIETNDKVEWRSARDLEGDLILSEDSQLTISCRTSLPSKAKVIVKPGAKLILDGGTLTNVCDSTWEGVEVWTMGKKAGMVEMLNGGTVERALN